MYLSFSSGDPEAVMSVAIMNSCKKGKKSHIYYSGYFMAVLKHSLTQLIAIKLIAKKWQQSCDKENTTRKGEGGSYLPSISILICTHPLCDFARGVGVCVQRIMGP